MARATKRTTSREFQSLEHESRYVVVEIGWGPAPPADVDGDEKQWLQDVATFAQPAHALDVNERLDGMASGVPEPVEFVTRDAGLERVAALNRECLARGPRNKSTDWYVLIEVGQCDDESTYLEVEGYQLGKLTRSQVVRMVRPTAEEIEMHCGVVAV